MVKTSAPPYGSIIRIGEFRDSVFGTGIEVDKLVNETLRMKTWNYKGIYILHCHIVEHEDAGLMGGYNVRSCEHAVNDSESSYCEFCQHCGGWDEWNNVCTKNLGGTKSVATVNGKTQHCCNFATNNVRKNYHFVDKGGNCYDGDVHEPKLARMCIELGGTPTCEDQSNEGHYKCTF